MHIMSFQNCSNFIIYFNSNFSIKPFSFAQLEIISPCTELPCTVYISSLCLIILYYIYWSILKAETLNHSVITFPQYLTTQESLFKVYDTFFFFSTPSNIYVIFNMIKLFLRMIMGKGIAILWKANLVIKNFKNLYLK